MSGVPVLGDLIGSDPVRLEIFCHGPGCHRHVQMPAAEAVAKLGARTTFPAAARRLRCSVCGARGRDKLVSCRSDVDDLAEIRWRDRQAREQG